MLSSVRPGVIQIPLKMKKLDEDHAESAAHPGSTFTGSDDDEMHAVLDLGGRNWSTQHGDDDLLISTGHPIWVLNQIYP